MIDKQDGNSGETSLATKVLLLDETLESAAFDHAFGGAIALAYYAEPRATIDIDLNVFVAPTFYPVLVSRLRPLGVGRFAHTSRVETEGQTRMWWGRTPLDFFFATLPIHEEMRERMRRVPFASRDIPILAPEHLLVAKAFFNRPKDWLDIEQMIIAVENLDMDRVRYWLGDMLGTDDERYQRVADLELHLRGEGDEPFDVGSSDFR